MIKIITNGRSQSSKMAIKWLTDHKIEYKEHNIKNKALKRKQLIDILKISDFGVESILATKSQIYNRYGGLKGFESMSLNGFIEQALNHPLLLSYPIIYCDNKLQVGYNEDEMGKFIPSKERQKKMKIYIGKNYEHNGGMVGKLHSTSMQLL